MDAFLDVLSGRKDQCPQSFDKLGPSRPEIEDLKKVVVHGPVVLGRHDDGEDCSPYHLGQLGFEPCPVVQLGQPDVKCLDWNESTTYSKNLIYFIVSLFLFIITSLKL